MPNRKQKPIENTITQPAIRIGASFLGIIVASALSVVLLYQVFAPQASSSRTYGLLIGLILITYAISSGIYLWHMAYRRFHQVKSAMEDLSIARAEADAANQAKTRFLAKMSHEIRTPMNGVLGMNALLIETGLSKEQQSYADGVDSSARALLSIIDEILDTSKIEANGFELKNEWFNPVEVIESLTELLAPRAHAKDIVIVCKISPKLPLQVKGDAKRLRQVLINLAGNAIKFTETGGVTISVNPAPASSQRDGRDGIIFRVCDTGIGISKNDQVKIFEPYAQTEEGAHKKYGGTGLGLPISLQIIEQMGSTIEVESKPESGTTFSFVLELPVKQATKENPSEKFAGKHIAIVNTKTPTTNVLQSYLSAFGATVTMVANLDEIKSWSSVEKVPEQILLECNDQKVIEKWLKALRIYAPKSHLWLVLQPEHRRYFRSILAHENVGFLVKPIRRNTLVRQILSPSQSPIIDSAVQSLREKVKQAKPLAAKKLSILLAEDNPINARLAMAMLSKSGHTITHVVNGVDAVKHIADIIDKKTAGALPDLILPDLILPDLILMDVFMPKLNGLEATKNIRALENKQTGRIPILALTANARKEDRKICKEAGMDGYLAKPFDQHDLEECMAGLVSAKHAA